MLILVIDLPFWIKDPVELPGRRLSCRICCNPVNDSCLLINESPCHIYLTRLTPTGDDQQCLERQDSHTVLHGVWRVSINETSESQQHML